MNGASGVEPGRPALAAADIAADLVEAAPLQNGADIVDQGGGDAAGVALGEQHGAQAAQ
jgi:hypothetical protein